MSTHDELLERQDSLGWTKGYGDDQEWYVPPEIWREEFCKGHDPGRMATALAERGMLRHDGKGDLRCGVYIPRLKKTVRVYVLTSKILDRETA